MTQQKNDKYSKVSTLKKALVIICFFGLFFGGLFAFIISVPKTRNYFHPYLFSLLLGTIGLTVGIFIAKKIKPYVILNKTMLSNYSILTFQFSTGFIGLFILAGHYFNFYVSTKTKCDEFISVDQNQTVLGYSFRRLKLNVLYVDIDGQLERLVCSSKYWNKVTNGQKVKVCIYSSPIGFDNLVLTDDY